MLFWNHNFNAKLIEEKYYLLSFFCHENKLKACSYGARVNPEIVYLPHSLPSCVQYDFRGQTITVFGNKVQYSY